MKKIKYMKEDLQYFLSLFDFEIDSYFELDERLSRGEYICIKDKNDDIIGNLYMDEKEKLYIQTFLRDSCLYATGYYSKVDNRFNFDFSIQNSESKLNLKGIFKPQKLHKKNRLNFLINILIFNDQQFICQYRFNNISESFDIIKNKQKVNYHRNRFKYNRHGRSLLLFHDKDGIFYNDMDFEEKHLNRVTGGYNFSAPNDNDSFLVEDEFNKVITEICPDYFDFIEEQKELLNTFSNELFENIFEFVYRNVNPKKLECITNALRPKDNIGLSKTMNTHKKL